MLPMTNDGAAAAAADDDDDDGCEGSVLVKEVCVSRRASETDVTAVL